MCYYVYMFNIFGNNDIEIGVGLDIGHNTIKVVELRRDKEGVNIQNYGEVELFSYAGLEMGQSVGLSNEQIAKAIKDLLEKSKIGIKNIYVSVPSIESYIFTINVKEVEGIEMSNVIDLEIRKYIPMPITELAVDHWPISKDIDKGEMKLSVIAVNKSVIDKYINIFKKAELNILGVEMETFSAVRALNLNDKNYLLIDSGGSYTTATLIIKGILYKSQTIQIGGNNITSVIKNSIMKSSYKETEILKRQLIDKEIENNSMMNIMDMSTYPLLEELGHIAENMEREYNLIIDEVIFVGGNAKACADNARIKDFFKTIVKVGSGFEKLNYPKYLVNLINRVGPSYSIACGLALKSFIKNNESKQS